MPKLSNKNHSVHMYNLPKAVKAVNALFQLASIIRIRDRPPGMNA